MTIIQKGSDNSYLSQTQDTSHTDIIKLSLPVNPAYVSAVRLTASSVANRLGFDIDEIEDVKAAVSEACTFIIKKRPVDLHDEYSIVFHLNDSSLTIEIKCKFKISLEANDDEMGVLMIKTLTDDFKLINNGEESTIIIMEKKHKEMF